jgi:hypothetical protein
MARKLLRFIPFGFLPLVWINFGSQPLLATDKASLFPILVKGQWGYMNSTGRQVIKPRFQSAGAFQDGLAIATTQSQRGYIDPAGQFVITVPSSLMPVSHWSEGLAVVRQAQTYGYIDRAGKLVIPARYGCAGNFVAGMARVCIGQAYGFINHQGQQVTQLYQDVLNFAEGLAPLGINGRRGYIDPTEKIVIQPQFDGASSFSEGLAQIRMDNHYGFINQIGKIVIQPVYSHTSDFSEGLAAVQIGGQGRYYGHWGYINRSGTLQIQPQFELAQPFSQGLAGVGIGDRMGYINRQGVVVIPPIFSMAYPFANGLARVEFTGCRAPEAKNKPHSPSNCEWGYINLSGKLVWKSRDHQR